jgi:DNA-binding NarL/FixJ family response regulator
MTGQEVKALLRALDAAVSAQSRDVAERVLDESAERAKRPEQVRSPAARASSAAGRRSQILKLRAEGKSIPEVAEEMGLTRATVHRVLSADRRHSERIEERRLAQVESEPVTDRSPKES